MSRARDQAGTVTVFVVSMTMALVLFIGLVLDGGATLAARREAIDEADGAARAAAQAIAPPTRGSAVATIDPGRAQGAVDAFLAPTGHGGQAVVQGDAVTVTVSFRQPMYVLGAGGLMSVTVTGRGTARAVSGIDTGGGG
ncbi:MAG: pilus assembly protein TadG-related protein [Actinomycetota bacterium]|nr:pilus assembly protein TadG-related protein [Actinomycetota bacterium]